MKKKDLFLTTNNFHTKVTTKVLTAAKILQCIIWVFRGQDSWMLASFFFACLWTKTKSRSINTQKKNEANIQSS